MIVSTHPKTVVFDSCYQLSAKNIQDKEFRLVAER
jgi:hypothetical protein